MMTMESKTKATAVVLISTVLSISVASVLYRYTFRTWRTRNKKKDVTSSSSMSMSTLSSAYEKLIGNTPMVRLDYISSICGRNIHVKMESLNPGGTGKDRAAYRMILQAESLGQLPMPTSGGGYGNSHRKTTDPPNHEKTSESTGEITTITTSDVNANATANANANTMTLSLQESISAAMRHSRSGGLVVEGTSGSTGISLATLCAARGHACIVVMPDDQAPEKKTILQALNAIVRTVPTSSISHPHHYVNTARHIATLATQRGIPAVFIDQFENMANYQTHYETTGPEIWNQIRQQSQSQTTTVDAFCMSSGTGGTIAGVARYLKEQNHQCRIVLVDPPGSALYHAIVHGIAYAPQQREQSLKRHRYDTLAEGIGLDRLTRNLQHAMSQQNDDNHDNHEDGSRSGYIDTAIRVSDQEAVDMAHYILKTEGLWIGSSSAMNIVGAIRTAYDMPPGSTIVTVICDAGQRHVTRFWNRTFILDWGLQWPGDDDNNTERIPECLKHSIVAADQ